MNAPSQNQLELAVWRIRRLLEQAAADPSCRRMAYRWILLAVKWAERHGEPDLIGRTLEEGGNNYA